MFPGHSAGASQRPFGKHLANTNTSTLTPATREIPVRPQRLANRQEFVQQAEPTKAGIVKAKHVEAV